MDSTQNTQGPVEIRPGYKVSELIYDAVWWQAIETMPSLKNDVDYSAAEILAPMWPDMYHGDRTIAGMCISHMVREGKLLLRFADQGSSTTKRYRLK